MIVTYTDKGWEIITQRAHGLLAAQVAFHWRSSDRTSRWVETVLAIGEHDDAQIELERNDLLTELGGPFNFDMRSFDLEHCRRTLDFSISKSRYIALLSAMHIIFVYGKQREHNVQAAALMEEIELLIKGWRKELSITRKQAQKDYDLLEWCDAFSLLVCQHENQPEARGIEISKGPDRIEYKLFQRQPGKLTVEPWPFEEHSFEVYFESRLIPQLQFRDSKEFKEAFHKARAKEMTWVVEKG